MFDLKNKINIIILVNVIIYLLTTYLSTNTGVSVYQLFGVNRALVIEYNEYYRIITSIFVHGGIMHLFFNMIALSYLAAPVINFTSEKFALISFFVTGIASSLGVIIFEANTIAVGASGAIYGLFGVLIYYAIKQYRMGYHGLIKSLGPIIVLNLMISFMPGISMSGHLTGLVVGYVITYFYDKKNRRYF